MAPNQEDGYTTKAECLANGFIKIGKFFYRLSILEQYARKGWLDFGDKKYTALDRLSAGARLNRDYYHGKFETVRANDVRKVKVDGHGDCALQEETLDARNRYLAAMKAVPAEFWDVVRSVCVEDKPIAANDNQNRTERLHEAYANKKDLCRGLDRLIEHYRRK